MSVFSAFIRGATPARKSANLRSVGDRGWHTLFGDRELGDWQRDIKLPHDSVVAMSTVFACITLIASDIGKLRLKLVELTKGIWKEVDSPAFGPVLRKPNSYQTRQQFIESWVTSKLTRGNAYVLKVRDGRGVVTGLHVLDPQCVTPLLSDSGNVYYRSTRDDLAGVPEGVPAIPASEIIHDRWNCLFHPLVGLSPIFACGLAATQGLKIQQNSARFFANMSRPSGILTGPTEISDETASRLKRDWESNYSGDRVGKVAVLGDNLKYESMAVNPIDAQLVAQLELSAKQVCSTFHVPAYMVGAEAVPPNNNVQQLTLGFYTQCLQSLIEAIEALLDDGLGLAAVTGHTYGSEFEIDDLLRMDTASMTGALNTAVAGGWMAPNEARAKRNLGPVKGGDSPMMQQQQFSLEALSQRDSDQPFSKPTPPVAPNPKEIAALANMTMRDELTRIFAG